MKKIKDQLLKLNGVIAQRTHMIKDNSLKSKSKEFPIIIIVVTNNKRNILF